MLFAVLASGSRGNSTLVKLDGPGLLIDLGLSPRVMQERLTASGACWQELGAAVLTHTHGDHVRDSMIRYLTRLEIPLYCHEGHLAALGRLRAFPALQAAGLVRHYGDEPFLIPSGLRVEPLALSHDGGPTYGFRIEGKPSRRLPSVAVGFVSDTGLWRPDMVEALADVDLLGVEFNHDVELERFSGRHPVLIARNLGHRGHLSNDQGAEFLSALLERSRQRKLRHVVLMHLSEQCNHPALAVETARRAAKQRGSKAAIHVALQDEASPILRVSPGARRKARIAVSVQAAFPWETS